ncbi:MAG: rod shape-determining protein MreD [Tissierellia bacterium]|nr:rod shape-determining protein MreD [Tissierellia bacterium]MDD4780652.1 rod shape-determining protein MreD [Tissierellia bacterium]
MKKIFAMIAIILINFIFQTSLYQFVSIFGVIPNISLILLVIFSMITNGIVGGSLGLLTGLLYDMMLQEIFGIYTLIYFVIGALIGSFSEELNRENYMLYGTATLLSTIFMHLSFFIILFFLKYRIDYSYYILGKIVLEIVLNTILTFFVLKFIVSLFSKLNYK